jgi:hypothetical protein
MRVLMIGDIYGKSGRDFVTRHLPAIHRELVPDWVIANGENATGGIGLSARHRDQMRAAGIDVFTSGNHIFGRDDWPEMIRGGDRVLRPHNIGADTHAGKGWIVLEAAGKPKLGVLNLAGRIFMDPADCPFEWADRLLERAGSGFPIVVDFHAEATSEKIALTWHLNGRVTLVAGTHTHVQTSDERILSGGTGAITDLGMTGPREGILGVATETVLSRFTKGYSDRFTCAEGPGCLEGALLDCSETGQAERLRRVRVVTDQAGALVFCVSN